MIIAGTGHRPDKLGGYSPLIAKELQAYAELQLHHLKPDTLITGMALGWDRAIAWAAHALRIPFWAYIPFVGQELMWPDASQDEYRELLGFAAKIVVCSPGGYAPQKMHIRNARMVNDSDEILAMWNGSPGGTANCLIYARSRNRPVHNCWQGWINRNS